MQVLFLFFASIAAAMPFIPSVMAHCPLCTGATVAGVGLTRSLGWDDSIVGVFVGGMIASSALWANRFFVKRKISGNNRLRLTALTALIAVLTLVTLYAAGIFGIQNESRIFGVERIMIGTVAGTAMTFFIFSWSNALKRKHNGNVLFPYQTMLLTLAALTATAAFLGVFL